ncbi:hypothetical protein LJC58_03040 [Lachnospiraceae bacterium OttesenSCG-928-D06]|nr:hypothetical protein [Lachnospiraceae bacterium OttesenSCG-928-D06]
MNNKNKYIIEAYFTVEATLNLVLVFLCIAFLVQIMVYQYNRCLLEQDVGILALRGAVLQEIEQEERLEKLQRMSENIYLSKYLFFQLEDITIKIEGQKIKLSQKGVQILNLFPLLSEITGQQWNVKGDYENEIISPTLFIRTIAKIKKLENHKENLNVTD